MSPLLALVWIAALAGTSRALAVTHLKRGDPAPVIAASSIDGLHVDTGTMHGKVLVLVFGDSGQDQTVQALAHIGMILDEPQLADEPMEWICVLSRNSDPASLTNTPMGFARKPILIHDRSRAAFGTYEVMVMPSVVVVDRQGKVVHALAGLLPRFDDIIADAVLLATGRISAERFERTLNPDEAAATAELKLRAERLRRLARRLQRRGTMELAEANYREALELDETLTLARIQLGELLASLGRLDEAEDEFRWVLASEPDSTEATLGLALIYVHRGPEKVGEAERLVREILKHSPLEARAHYLMGQIHEHRRHLEEAAAAYRKAAELLLEQRG